MDKEKQSKMDASTNHAAELSVDDFAPIPPAMQRASLLWEEGRAEEAIRELEKAMEKFEPTGPGVDLQTRGTLAIMLSDFYQESGLVDQARDLLRTEVLAVEKQYEAVKTTGTPFERKAIFGNLSILRDQYTQVSLIGNPAPEIEVKRWINSKPLSLESERGNVVLLEFWATWCKPCEESFPNLKSLFEGFSNRGLRVLALTRYYFSIHGTADSEENETLLIEKYVSDKRLPFPVGISEGTNTQMKYGAVGLPTLVLIDRRGTVRSYGRFDSDELDPRFSSLVERYLDENN